jgi:DNA-binding winged helix-turn-helix (wHTH) protein
MSNILHAGPLELDLVNRKGKRGDRSFDLRPREVRLLKYTMKRSGQMLTYAQILQDLWFHKSFPKEAHRVHAYMSVLRRKVDGSNEPPMIRNIRGEGFILDATGEADLAGPTPEYIDWVADDIIGATGDLFDDYDVVRKIARAAIASIAEYRAERHRNSDSGVPRAPVERCQP